MNLYDTEGKQTGICDYDGLDPADRDHVLQDGNDYYIWNQRNSQWRLAGDVVKLGPVTPFEPSSEEPPPPDPVPAPLMAPPEPETPLA